MLFHQFDSPYGEILAWGDGKQVEGICFKEHMTVPRVNDWERDARSFRAVERQFSLYFSGELREFDLPLRMEGSDFRCGVWKELAEIKYGETLSYGSLASRLGCDGGARAVGGALGSNLLSVVVPCHRVISWDGGLGGYGGGLWLKRELLELEG